MIEYRIWMFIGMFWAVALIIELLVVLIWVKGRAKLLAGGGLALMVFAQVVLSSLISGPAVTSLRQLLNLTGLVLLGYGLIASRPRQAVDQPLSTTTGQSA